MSSVRLVWAEAHSLEAQLQAAIHKAATLVIITKATPLLEPAAHLGTLADTGDLMVDLVL
jgi:hypothetical protein